MKITLVPSSVSSGPAAQNQFLTSFLVNESIAIDAGSLGFFGSPQEQARVKHVILTHTHIDHIASLPVFVENAYEAKRDCVVIHAADEVVDCLRADIFNDRVWPDFLRLSDPNAPLMRFERIEAYRPFELDGLTFTPVPVDHLVPTLGLIIQEPGATVVIPSDTGPTEEIWERTNAAPDLKAIFLEAAFPNALGWLADVSKHLTPSLFGGEARKVKKGVRMLAVHIKARYIDEIASELESLGLADLEICQPGVPYHF